MLTLFDEDTLVVKLSDIVVMPDDTLELNVVDVEVLVLALE